MLEWPEYAISLREQFDSSMFTKPMSKLVTLKQQGSVEQYHNEFVSFLNKLNLPESYALCIFTSNLQLEISLYINLFSPQTLGEAFHPVRKVQCILNTSLKKGFLVGANFVSRYVSQITTHSRLVSVSQTGCIVPLVLQITLMQQKVMLKVLVLL